VNRSSRYGSWICCQLGAREHYAVPRALHRSGYLDRLITDIWLYPNSRLGVVTRNLRDRFHPELENATVQSLNLGALAFEAKCRLQGFSGWRLICERNEWFQRRVIAELTRRVRNGSRGTFILFVYSYAAYHLLEFAREHGWTTVLGQIDPGPAGERIVRRLYDENPGYREDWQPAPPDYWNQWRKECALADRILVNSSWSRAALVEEGVAAEKISVIPLAFEAGPEAESFERRYPATFTTERPLRVLFLGQVNSGKGVGPLLDAARLLRGEPVEFWFVGPVQIAVPAELKQQARIRWIGVVSRGEVARYYREADVFVFPTFSDGFGLTQLEAQAWKLPVISTRFCGNVVRDSLNGVILDDLSGNGIATVLCKFLQNPGILREMSGRSGVDDIFSVDSLGSALLNL
jgi:glycosyltransferase involved in cell wall biosynthesis